MRAIQKYDAAKNGQRNFHGCSVNLMFVRTILTSTNSCQENCVANDSTRRSFLKLSAMRLAATASAEFSLATSKPGAAPQSGEIAVRVTGGNSRHESAP